MFLWKLFNIGILINCKYKMYHRNVAANVKLLHYKIGRILFLNINSIANDTKSLQT